MRRKYLLGIILFTFIFTATAVLFSNLDKIRFTLNLVELYRSTTIDKDQYTTPDISIVENPLEKIIEQEEIVDIEVNSEDNIETIEESIIPNEDTIILNNETGNLNQLPEENNISFHSIVSDYNYRFKSIEDELRVSLLKLIENGFNDFRSGAYTDTDLANKYLEEGAKLESLIDNKFYTLLREFESDLRTNSYSTESISSFEDYYILRKEQIRTDIINKGLELVRG